MQTPIAALAMALLRQVPSAQHSARTATFGRSNFIGLERERHFDRRTPRPSVDHHRWEQHISSTFDWLVAQGLVTRDASQRGDNWLLRSELGDQAVAAENPQRFIDAHKALALRLHPSIDQRVRNQLALGDIEDAVGVAVRQVERAVRERADLPKSLGGHKLMTAAFKPDSGPLHDPELERSEQEGVMYLFMGLTGALRNPTSHRQVDYADLAEAVEVIHFADLLLRIVDRA